MSGESPEDLRHTAAQDRKDEVGEKQEGKEKNSLLIMTNECRLYTIKPCSVCLLYTSPSPRDRG